MYGALGGDPPDDPPSMWLPRERIKKRLQLNITGFGV